MNPKNPKVYTDEQLPDRMQADLEKLMSAMKKRYGASATRLGTHIENLAVVCAMISDGATMDEQTRTAAYANASSVCMAVLRDLGEAHNVDLSAAFAVAAALQEYTRHAGDELCGEPPMPEAVTDEAAQVMARAAAR